MPTTPARRFTPLLVLTLFLLGSTFSFAADKESAQAEPATETLVDTTHSSISAGLNSASQWFDDFFGDPRIDEEPAGTMLRLRGSTIMTEAEGVSFKGKIKLNVELPNLKSRYQLILSNEDDDLSAEAASGTQSPERPGVQDKGTSLGLQYTKRTNQNLIYSNRVSIDYEDGLNPQLKTRLRYTLPVSEASQFNFTQALTWENNEGFGQENRIDFDYTLNDQMLLRTTGNGLFSESSNGYEWLALQQLLTSFSHKKAMTFGSYVRGETRPQNHVTEYVLFTEYRQSFIKKWLFFELRPEINWQREHQFKAATAFTLTLEVRFGER